MAYVLTGPQAALLTYCDGTRERDGRTHTASRKLVEDIEIPPVHGVYEAQTRPLF